MDQGTMTLLIYVVVFGGIMYFSHDPPTAKTSETKTSYAG